LLSFATGTKVMFTNFWFATVYDFSHDEQRCVLFRQRGDCSGVTEPLVCAGAVTLLSVDYVFIHTQTELCAPASTLTHTQTRSWFSTARM